MVIFLFGSRLKELRTLKKDSQDNIAELLNVSRNTVSNWENNKGIADGKELAILSEYFNVSTDYLLCLNQEDVDNINKLNTALREAGLVNSDETLKTEEIKLAVEQVRQMKKLWIKNNTISEDDIIPFDKGEL